MRNWLWLVLFSVFWLLPMVSRALVDRPAPTAHPIIDAYANFCLFQYSQDFIPIQYIQLLLPGDTDWTTAAEGEYFSMSPFGARTRFEEMLRKRLDNQRALAEVAAFVRLRYARREGVLPLGVRFVTGVALPSAYPESGFSRPALSEIHHTRRDVWFAVLYEPVSPEIARRRP